jgi:succinate dehydrogenase / fumarate reductase cytochrome b subunit
MNKILAFWRSTVGKKVVMAVTGIIGIGYVIIHIAGNMMAFKGAEAMDGYANMLHTSGAELLWVARVILLASVILHVVAAYQLTRISQAARPQKYVERQPQVSTYASRLMRWGGVVLLAFIIFHILHFTTGHVRPGTFVEHRPYINVVTSFKVWWVSAFYLIAMAFLGLHLFHGTWSSVRTLGATGRSKNPLHRSIAIAIATFAWLGFSIIPIAVMLGWIQ